MKKYLGLVFLISCFFPCTSVKTQSSNNLPYWVIHSKIHFTVGEFDYSFEKPDGSLTPIPDKYVSMYKGLEKTTNLTGKIVQNSTPTFLFSFDMEVAITENVNGEMTLENAKFTIISTKVSENHDIVFHVSEPELLLQPGGDNTAGYLFIQIDFKSIGPGTIFALPIELGGRSNNPFVYDLTYEVQLEIHDGLPFLRLILLKEKQHDSGVDINEGIDWEPNFLEPTIPIDDFHLDWKCDCGW